jgi:hypothetical protein
MLPKHVKYPSLQGQFVTVDDAYTELTAHATHDLLFIVNRSHEAIHMGRTSSRISKAPYLSQTDFIADSVSSPAPKKKTGLCDTFEVAIWGRNRT